MKHYRFFVGFLLALTLVGYACAQAGPPTLVVGSEQDYPPFATGMTDATAGGFTVELWKAVAREAGLNYTLRVRPFHVLLEEFKAGKIDVLINLAVSDERSKFSSFSVPHVVVHGAIFVRKDEADIKSEDDLAGKSIIVMKADIAHEYAQTRGWGSKLVTVNTAADGMRLLASGKHDAMVLSKLVGMQTLQAEKLKSIVAINVPAGFSLKYAFATQRGQTDLLARINENLALTKASGIYEVLYEKWFGVYTDRAVGLRELLKYLIPVVVIFLIWVGYLLYRRHLDRALAVAELAQSRDLLLTVINTAPIRVFWKDRNLRFLGCNVAFAKDAGLTHPDELIGKDDFQMAWAEQAENYRADDLAVIQSGSSKLFYDECQTTPDGRTVWLRTSKVPLRNQDKEIIGILGVYEDITEHKQLQDEVRQLAFYDPLTQLPNRRLLNDRLDRAMAACRRSDSRGALMVLDLDNFKSLNDTRGHMVGDLLLIEAAMRLNRCVREMDTVSRFGGDEFVVMLSNLGAEISESHRQASHIAEKIRVALSEPYELLVKQVGHPDRTVVHQCSASIGMVLFSGEEADQESIIKRADAAMYQAKNAGRNLVNFHQQED